MNATFRNITLDLQQDALLSRNPNTQQNDASQAKIWNISKSEYSGKVDKAEHNVNMFFHKKLKLICLKFFLHHKFSADPVTTLSCPLYD